LFVPIYFFDRHCFYILFVIITVLLLLIICLFLCLSIYLYVARTFVCILKTNIQSIQNYQKLFISTFFLNNRKFLKSTDCIFVCAHLYHKDFYFYLYRVKIQGLKYRWLFFDIIEMCVLCVFYFYITVMLLLLTWANCTFMLHSVLNFLTVLRYL